MNKKGQAIVEYVLLIVILVVAITNVINVLRTGIVKLAFKPISQELQTNVLIVGNEKLP